MGQTTTKPPPAALDDRFPIAFPPAPSVERALPLLDEIDASAWDASAAVQPAAELYVPPSACQRAPKVVGDAPPPPNVVTATDATAREAVDQSNATKCATANDGEAGADATAGTTGAGFRSAETTGATAINGEATGDDNNQGRTHHPIQILLKLCFLRLQEEFTIISFKQREWMVEQSKSTTKACNEYTDKFKADIDKMWQSLSVHVNNSNQINFRNIAKLAQEVQVLQASVSWTQGHSVQVSKDATNYQTALKEQSNKVSAEIKRLHDRMEKFEGALITERVVYADEEKPTWAKKLEQSVQQQLRDAKDWNLDLSSQLYATQSTLEDNQVRLDEAQTLLEDSNARLHEARSTLEETRTQLTETKAALKTAMSHLGENRTQFDQAKAFLQKFQAQAVKTMSELEEARSQIRMQAEELQRYKDLDVSKSQLWDQAVSSGHKKVDTTDKLDSRLSAIQLFRKKVQEFNALDDDNSAAKHGVSGEKSQQQATPRATPQPEQSPPPSPSETPPKKCLTRVQTVSPEEKRPSSPQAMPHLPSNETPSIKRPTCQNHPKNFACEENQKKLLRSPSPNTSQPKPPSSSNEKNSEAQEEAMTPEPPHKKRRLRDLFDADENAITAPRGVSPASALEEGNA